MEKQSQNLSYFFPFFLSVSRSGVDLSGGNLEILVENERLVVDWGGDQVGAAPFLYVSFFIIVGS